MKIMIDTNVIISSLIKQGSVPDIVLNYVCYNHDLVLCDQIINECYIVAKRRFPDKIDVLSNFFAQMKYKLVTAPGTEESKIIDVKDQNILNAAIANNVKILISGDKHFLELDLDAPQITNPSEFKRLYIDSQTPST